MAKKKSPFPEVAADVIEDIAAETALDADPFDLVSSVITALLRRPSVLVELAARFGQVRVQQAPLGVAKVDDKDKPLSPKEIAL